jgi:calcium/calmodulin-dependent protein kinase I
VYEDKKFVYFVMDFQDGGELFDRIIKKGNYTEKDACILMRSLLLDLNRKNIIILTYFSHSLK